MRERCPPQAYAVLGAADTRSCSSVTTPAWPRLVAQKKGVWPYISLVGVDVAPPEKCSHHSLLPIRSSTQERCFAVDIWFAGVDVASPK